MTRFFLLSLFACALAAGRPALARPAIETCEASYRALYGKPVVNVRVVFGYKDTRPGRFVGDRHERLAFVQRILKTCDKGQACGFTRSTQNSDLFVKTIKGPQGKRVRVQLWVAHSSVGSDDQENRRDSLQSWQSRYSADAFFSGLGKADVLFYNGHSRFGGGPDFSPPRLDRAGVVETAFYKDERPGFARTIDVLEAETLLSGRSGKLKLMGLFSCTSSQHFSEDIRFAADVGLLSSHQLMYYADAMESSLAALSGLLEMKCEGELRRSIRAGSPLRAMKVDGFFKKRSAAAQGPLSIRK